MRRRAFFGLGLAGVLGGCSKRGGGAYWRYFKPEEARTVEAICAQLIPADQDPGALEARAAHYIDWQLHFKFRRHRAAYRKGLESVNESSRRLHGRAFADLSGEQAAAVLRDLEKNSREFFDLVLAHTRQGYYGDPRHGGNYRMASWKMVRLPFPQVRGRQRYEG